MDMNLQPPPPWFNWMRMSDDWKSFFWKIIRDLCQEKFTNPEILSEKLNQLGLEKLEEVMAFMVVTGAAVITLVPNGSQTEYYFQFWSGTQYTEGELPSTDSLETRYLDVEAYILFFADRLQKLKDLQDQKGATHGEQSTIIKRVKRIIIPE